MRVIESAEKKQRGCQYCQHKDNTKIFGDIRTSCPFAECPFHVLDKYETFEEFLASEDSKILVNEFFVSAAGFYELPKSERKSNKVFSDGDAKINIMG